MDNCSFFKTFTVLSCLLLHTVTSNPLTSTPATTIVPVAKRVVPGDWVAQVGDTTYLGNPTSTVQPTYGASCSEAVSSAASSAYAMVTDSPNEFEIIASYSTTKTNVETLAVCIVNTNGGDTFDATDDDIWDLIVDRTTDAYIDDLDVVAEANYEILVDPGDDTVTTTAFVDLLISTSTIGS